MPDIQKAFLRSQHKSAGVSKSSGKRKSFQVKGEETLSPNTPKKRKVDQLEHVPTLISSTFNPLEEIDFPRGGSALTPLEKKQAENEGIRDALFEVLSPILGLTLTLDVTRRRDIEKEGQGEEVKGDRTRYGGIAEIRWTKN
jgi:hypothetical protein